MIYGDANRLISYNGTSISYDADGNMLSSPLGDKWGALTYNSENMLMEVTVSGSAIAAYTYDAEGNRSAKTEKGVTTTYVVDTNAALSRVLMATENGEMTYYIYGLGLIAQENSDGYKTYHYDSRGSTTAITDINGNVTDRIYYDPYGSIVSRTGTTDTPFLYAGEYGVETDESGLYYMRARYYNPQIQRFINVDPVRDNNNWYAYADGNSISSIDPTGMMDWSTQAELYMHGFWDATVDFSDATKKEFFSFLDNPLDYIYDTGKDIAGGIKDVSAGIVSGEITPLSIISSGAGWVGKSVKGIYDWGYKWLPFTTITDEEAYQLGYSGADTLYDTSEFVVKFAAAYKGTTYVGKVLNKAKIKINSLKKSYDKTNTVWDNIKPSQPMFTGTQIPKSFKIMIKGEEYWVHPNATKHMYEYVTRNGQHIGTFTTPINSQMMLTEFKYALEDAIKRNGLKLDEMIYGGDWEFIITSAREGGLSNVIKHARYNPYH